MGGLRTLYTIVFRSEFALKIWIRIKKKVVLAGKKVSLGSQFRNQKSVLEDQMYTNNLYLALLYQSSLKAETLLKK